MNSNITSKQLKTYCDYIIEHYIMINPCYEDSRIYHQLKGYSETGEVKGVIYKNTNREIKGEWLGMMARKVNIFYNNHEETIKLYVRKKKMDKLLGN